MRKEAKTGSTCLLLTETALSGDALLELALLGGVLLYGGDLDDVVDVVEHGGIGGEVEAVVVPGVSDLGERAADELLEPIPPGVDEEDDEPEHDGGGVGVIPPWPVQVAQAKD
jgi:hypothetical protein